MELKVYNGEYFERSKRWYLAYGVALFTMLILGLLYENIRGSLLLLLFSGAYFYMQSQVAIVINLQLGEGWLALGRRFFSFVELKGFLVEVDKNTGKFVNLVLILSHSNEILTLADTDEQLHYFCKSLSEKIPMLERYEQTWTEKLMRKWKM